MLVAQDITKSYGAKEVLKGVSLSIVPGQITALIGPNGCGKSTLLRALALLDRPNSGRIVIDGVEYRFPEDKERSIESLWPKLTMVFQQLFLWPHLTLRENITLPLRSRNGKTFKDEVEALIDRLDMRGFIDRYPNQVSLGQRQRAAIARALALEPRYLLLDEITSALDVEQVSVVLNQLRMLRNQGTSILLITHLIGFAKRAADQVLMMWDGKILESGGAEVLTSPATPEMTKFLSLLE